MPLLRLSLLASLPCTLLFSAVLSSDPDDTSLVIYNAGIGLVHESRALKTDAGAQSIVYPDVATTVQTDSVNVVFPEGIALYSQQYRFDKITLAKILEAHVGKTVRFQTGEALDGPVQHGVLLALNPPVVKTQRGVESVPRPEAFIFDAIPETLIMKPSLVWNVDAVRPVEGTMSLDYLLSGIQWKSDYVLNLDGDAGDLSGWITVDNRSGKRFERTRLKLLAGEINRPTVPVRYADVMAMEKATVASVAQQAHEGYHLYSVPFDVTLADNEKTQIKFVDQPSHPLKRLYEVTMQVPFDTGTERKLPVTQSVELAGFPVPLPGGIVRTYSKADDTHILLGETRLDNTPKDEKVKLRLGTHFDLVAKNRLLSRSDDNRYLAATVAYTLANRSERPQTVDVVIPGIYENGMHATTLQSKEPYTRPDGTSVRFSIRLNAGEEKEWNVSYRMRKQ